MYELRERPSSRTVGFLQHSPIGGIEAGEANPKPVLLPLSERKEGFPAELIDLIAQTPTRRMKIEAIRQSLLRTLQVRNGPYLTVSYTLLVAFMATTTTWFLNEDKAIVGIFASIAGACVLALLAAGLTVARLPSVVIALDALAFAIAQAGEGREGNKHRRFLRRESA